MLLYNNKAHDFTDCGILSQSKIDILEDLAIQIHNQTVEIDYLKGYYYGKYDKQSPT